MKGRDKWTWREALSARALGAALLVAPKHTLDTFVPLLGERLLRGTPTTAEREDG